MALLRVAPHACVAWVRGRIFVLLPSPAPTARAAPHLAPCGIRMRERTSALPCGATSTIPTMTSASATSQRLPLEKSAPLEEKLREDGGYEGAYKTKGVARGREGRKEGGRSMARGIWRSFFIRFPYSPDFCLHFMNSNYRLSGSTSTNPCAHMALYVMVFASGSHARPGITLFVVIHFDRNFVLNYVVTQISTTSS